MKYFIDWINFIDYYQEKGSCAEEFYPSGRVIPLSPSPTQSENYVFDRNVVRSAIARDAIDRKKSESTTSS